MVAVLVSVIAYLGFNKSFDTISTAIWLGGALILSIILGHFVSHSISEPIEKLTHNVTEITRGNLGIQLERSSIAEIQSLTYSLSRILASMKLAMLRAGAKKQEFAVGETTAATDVAVEEKPKAEETPVKKPIKTPKKSVVAKKAKSKKPAMPTKKELEEVFLGKTAKKKK